MNYAKCMFALTHSLLTAAEQHSYIKVVFEAGVSQGESFIWIHSKEEVFLTLVKVNVYIAFPLILVVLSEMRIWLFHTHSLTAVLCGFPVKQPSLTWWLTRFKTEKATWGLINIVNTYPTVPFFFPIFHFSLATWEEKMVERVRRVYKTM